MPKRPPRTLLELCVARAGLIKGAKLAEFIASWAIATGGLGHEPGVREFAEWWRLRSPRTAFNRLRDFRAAFPEYDTPGPLAAPLAATLGPVGERIEAADVTRLVTASIDLPAALAAGA